MTDTSGLAISIDDDTVRINDTPFDADEYERIRTRILRNAFDGEYSHFTGMGGVSVVRDGDALQVAPLRLPHGIDVGDVLLLSRTNDPDWMGTPADHKKAEWFRGLWEHAVADRSDPEIHTRGVHYATVMRDEEIEPPTNCGWDYYQNTATCYGYLSSAASAARILGYVPLDGIVDEKNDQRRLTVAGPHQLDLDPGEVDTPTIVSAPQIPSVDTTAQLSFETVEEVIDYIARTVAEEFVEQLSPDLEREQPFHVEIWSEKTLPSEVTRTAQLHGVGAIVEGQGDLSYTLAKDFAQRVNRAGKPGVILYLSDFDPAGSNMANAMASKICWLDRTGRLEQRVMVDRLAITADQVEEHELPRKPIDTADVPEAYETRVDEWQREHDGGAVELNVLESDITLFREIIREGVRALRDDQLREKYRAAKEEWQATAKETIRETLREHQDELDEQLAETAAWCEEFNEALADAREHFERLRELRGEPAFNRWPILASPRRYDRDGDLLDQLPEFDPPEGEAPLPADPLFDTRRSRIENVQRAHGLNLDRDVDPDPDDD